ncbi:tripartite tricarboxylate transporter permease [Candidatus Laterigemmans baculatus]|nr:tripartite tricarboxylate transporter permease [Candidatus Laterigemmans baculatus]
MILTALEQVFLDPRVWIVCLLSAVYGIFIGAVPGLTATMAVALFVPMTFWMDDLLSITAIVTMTACAIFAGDVPTALLRIPGTPASAAYADQMYALTQRGRASSALCVSLVHSVVGGLLGAVVLIFLGRSLAGYAAEFSVAEYFWLYLLGLSSAVVVTRGPALKALFGLLVGLMLATVGLSAVHASPRFTFGQPELYQGINFIPAMIGLFGLSEILANLLSSGRETAAATGAAPAASDSSLWGALAVAGRKLKSRFLGVGRSGAVGAAIGTLPGAGADIAAWVSLAASRRGPDQDLEEQELADVADAATANSAALAGAWIPSLVFGIPGDSVTAMVIGVLLMKNITPGPTIYENNGALVYSIYLMFILANLMLIPVGLLAIRLGGLVVRIPKRVLLPIILLFCLIGAFAINGSYFDVYTMLGCGVLGLILDRRQIPLGPVVLGIVLGGAVEERFIQAVTAADGSPLALVSRPVSVVLALLCLGLWSWRIFSHWYRPGVNSFSKP